MADIAVVTRIIEKLYNLPRIVAAQKLNSYDGRNFLVRTDGEEWFVLKLIASSESLQGAHECQLKVMQHLHSKGYSCPKTVTAANGKCINRMPENKFSDIHPPADKDYFLVTLLEFIPGLMLSALHPVPYHLFHEGGQVLANLHKLTKVYNGNIQPLKDLNSQSPWSLHNTAVIRESLSVIKDGVLSSIISTVIDQFEDQVTPVLNRLPCGIIHGDYNDDNIIVHEVSGKAFSNPAARGINPTEERSLVISGVIDFSDMTYSCLVFDISVALSFMVITDVPDIVEAIEHFVRGYSSVRPLVKEEHDVLLICLLLSLAQNLVLALRDHSSDPSNDYLLVSVDVYPVMLRKLYALYKDGAKLMLS